MTASALRSAAAAHQPHTALVLYAVTAGLAMVALGAMRLRLPLAPASPHTPRGIVATYSLMIALGLLLIGLAVRWRFFV